MNAWHNITPLILVYSLVRDSRPMTLRAPFGGVIPCD